MRKSDRQSYMNLVDLEEFFLLIGFELFLSICEGHCNGFNFIIDLVSLLFKVTLSLWILFYFLIIFTNFSDSFKVFVIILNDSDIRFFILILKLVLTLFWLLLLFLLVFIVFIVVTLLLLLLYFGLFLKLANSFPLSNLVVSNYSFSHLIIIRVNEFPQDFFLLLVLLFEFLVEHLNFANFSG